MKKFMFFFAVVCLLVLGAILCAHSVRYTEYTYKGEKKEMKSHDFHFKYHLYDDTDCIVTKVHYSLKRKTEKPVAMVEQGIVVKEMENLRLTLANERSREKPVNPELFKSFGVLEKNWGADSLVSFIWKRMLESEQFAEYSGLNGFYDIWDKYISKTSSVIQEKIKIISLNSWSSPFWYYRYAGKDGFFPTHISVTIAESNHGCFTRFVTSPLWKFKPEKLMLFSLVSRDERIKKLIFNECFRFQLGLGEYELKKIKK